jgi:hypothetical protein
MDFEYCQARFLHNGSLKMRKLARKLRAEIPNEKLQNLLSIFSKYRRNQVVL